jgi:hypothetical protein
VFLICLRSELHICAPAHCTRATCSQCTPRMLPGAGGGPATMFTSCYNWQSAVRAPQVPGQPQVLRLSFCVALPR